ncbi:hypothetical protein HPB47_014700 [Ixodes persulcatus]|uniref:Uncharacterized protein n=1 Tax=Ixodes persulcatus TaxID=34615 RepID=A0AC60QX78_IXOPE|nr:hypothetical protein HPB47_014700 [Ixodes persulcatus]
MLFQLITLMSLRYDIPTVLSINLVSIGGSNGSVSLTFALGPSLETRWGGEMAYFRETWRLASLEYIPLNGTLIVEQIKKDVTIAALKQLVGHCGAKYKLWHLVHDKVTKLRIRMPEENVYRDIELPSMTHNFVLNYIALKRYSQEVKVRRAQTGMSEGIMDDETLGFTYFAEENSVYLTPPWFQQPMFYPKSEPFVNYAVIGAILGGLTHQAVGRSGRNHDANGNLKSWWTHNLGVAIEEQQECFRREYIDVSDGEPSPSLLDEIWAISEGLELVWEDVVAYGLDDGNVQINGKTFTWRQFFFIRFCSVWCNYARTPAENAWRCNVPLRHIPGFAYSFNCSGSKAMGYRHSCTRKLPCH